MTSQGRQALFFSTKTGLPPQVGLFLVVFTTLHENGTFNLTSRRLPPRGCIESRLRLLIYRPTVETNIDGWSGTHDSDADNVGNLVKFYCPACALLAYGCEYFISRYHYLERNSSNSCLLYYDDALIHTSNYRYKKRQTVSDCMILLPSFCGAWWYIWMKAILWRTLTWINFYSVRQPNCGNVTVRFVHHKSFMALKWVAWKNLTIYRWKNNDSIVVVFWEKILFWCSASVWPNLTKYEFWAAENLNFKDLMPSSFFWLWNLKVLHSCIQFPHKI